MPIYEIKSEHCLGFSISENEPLNTFYFMDEHKIVNKLKRMKEKRTLIETDEFVLKDKEFNNFDEVSMFEHVILDD